MQLRTINGYDFFACSSAMQKAIRRNDVKHAGYFAMELFKSGYQEYVFKRLFIISAEDCAGLITQEIRALYAGYTKATTPKPKGDKIKGAVFAAKGVILLCHAIKNRDADHMIGLLWEQKRSVKDEEINMLLTDAPEYLQIPEYSYDFHTYKGKQRGKTKDDFFKEEFDVLTPKQVGLFDNLVHS